ncbi:MAG TPA: hypothetical protein PLV32_14505, partial [Chitinophagaceae bacterium]|nr:hypothetical protein [Chitinophagaceae bacterium]
GSHFLYPVRQSQVRAYELRRCSVRQQLFQNAGPGYSDIQQEEQKMDEHQQVDFTLRSCG